MNYIEDINSIFEERSSAFIIYNESIEDFVNKVKSYVISKITDKALKSGGKDEAHNMKVVVDEIVEHVKKMKISKTLKGTLNQRELKSAFQGAFASKNLDKLSSTTKAKIINAAMSSLNQ